MCRTFRITTPVDRREDVTAADRGQLLALALEGHHTRTELQQLQRHVQFPPAIEDPQAVLTVAYFCAVSIYLSGIYDYDPIWVLLDLPTPNLPFELVGQYVDQILTVSEIGLRSTCLSPLLFIIPLRIAGARARTRGEQEHILRLLGMVEDRFAVVAAVRADLGDLWSRRRGLTDAIS